MGLLGKLREASKATYLCFHCGRTLEVGDEFWIKGTMSSEILHGSIGRADLHVKSLGTLVCARCHADWQNKS
jgi:hypothetical protein